MHLLKLASVILVLKIFAIFLFECPFYAIQRKTLAINVIDILQMKNLSHLGNQPELYLYGHLLISLIIDKFYSLRHFYIYVTFISTSFLYLRHFYIYATFISTSLLYLRHYYIYVTFISTSLLYLRHFYIYVTFISTSLLYLRHFYIYVTFISTSLLYLRHFYIYLVCSNCFDKVAVNLRRNINILNY